MPASLSGDGVLAHYQGDYDRAEELCQEALELSRSLGDSQGVAQAYTGLALVRRTRGDYPGAERLFREALAVYEGLGDEEGIARTIDRLALHFVVTGDDDLARPLFERSLELFRRLGDSQRHRGIALRSRRRTSRRGSRRPHGHTPRRASTSCAGPATAVPSARCSGKLRKSTPTSATRGRGASSRKR